jgi:hypothetical protein
LPFALSYENNQNGQTLNLGELRRRGITVTAFHNDWLFEEPRLIYMHWEKVGDPFEFARNSMAAVSEACCTPMEKALFESCSPLDAE